MHEKQEYIYCQNASPREYAQCTFTKPLECIIYSLQSKNSLSQKEERSAVLTKVKSQAEARFGYQHPQRLDFLNSNMSWLVAWVVTTQIGHNKKANT